MVSFTRGVQVMSPSSLTYVSFRYIFASQVSDSLALVDESERIGHLAREDVQIQQINCLLHTLT